MEKEFSKEQIKMCLSCRKCHDVVRDYNEIYQIGKNDNVNSEESFLLNSQKEVIEELAELLDFSGNLVEKYSKLRELSKNTSVYQEKNCLNNISIILYAINGFYEEDDETRVFEKYKNVVPVLNCMNEFNNTNNKDYPYKRYQQYISLFSSNKYEDKREEIRAGLIEVFESYCHAEVKQFLIDEGRNCEAYKFEMFVKGLDRNYLKRRKEFFERIDKLEVKKAQLIISYLKYAPKSFSINLCKVMKEQDMSENDICQIIGNDTMSISTFQSLMECKEPKQDRHRIELVARALLVSMDVLYKGVGKRYGNWKDILNKDTIRCVRNLLEDSLIKKDSDAKNYIRKEIKEFIEMDEVKYNTILKELPDFFVEEDYVIYEDRIEMFDALLHHDEVFTLLEVIENC